MTQISRPALIALVLLFSLIWSSAFVAGKIAVRDVDPILALVIRFALSAAIMAPFCLGNRVAWNTRIVKTGLLFGLLNNAVYLGMNFSALAFTSAAVVGVIVSCAPFLAILFSVALGHERFDLVKTLGVFIGFAGVIVIIGFDIGAGDAVGVALAVGGTTAFAMATVLFRGRATGLPVITLNFWQSTAGALALLPVLALKGVVAPTFTVSATLAILYLTVVVSIGASVLWLLLIRWSGAASAASYHLLNPFWVVILSYIALGTPLEPRAFVGAAIIGAGLLLTTRSAAPVAPPALAKSGERC
ncbi:drug/metabolite transporter [Rhodomicrobium udaipurense JA643]|uniref:DMT family transporter n=1 Tax=Rhodomicrobium udaipurense TaxID=1202716 RepID=A0A8I1GE86_9HYPH|nr:DMT family transporter [Rhodomicrobium udaipurense]KAI95393.1 drug/metabolite transporter [Rhodomicrobium udaipurense JA643]MBJ7542146.1 DMT family transporter [Rhodomicrobium udaipurense]